MKLLRRQTPLGTSARTTRESILGRYARKAMCPVLAVALASAFVVPSFAGAQSNSTTAKASSRTPKPTIVLVHGGWADSSSWDGVIAILQREGYTVDAPPNPLQGLPSDTAFLASYLKTISGPVVLVGHSYGGMVITDAATGNANVKALVYIDAFEPAQGTTVGGLTFAQPGSCLAGGGTLGNVVNLVPDPSLPTGDPDAYLKTAAGPGYPGFSACFANDVTPGEASLLAVTQRPIALGALTDPSGPPAWATVPSWALIGTQDHVIPPAELLFMANRAHSTVETVKAGHLSMVSQPQAAASLIARAASASS